MKDLTDEETGDFAPQEPEIVELEITDTLDLHPFPPREVKELVRDWLDLAHEAGFRGLRIIHGKGTGALRAAIREALSRHPLVRRYETAPPREGGDGVTIAVLAG